jgi:hypothetical protein
MTIKRPGDFAKSEPKWYEGSAMPSDTLADVLSIELERMIVSLRTRDVVRWVWADEAPEQFRLHLATGAIIVEGKGLRCLHDSLNRGKLRLLRTTAAGASTEPCIGSITFYDKKHLSR